jgi:hypothetical protein
MSYILEIEDDYGLCPRCGSSDTISIASKAKRACLKCEFSEEFEDQRIALLGWRPKVKAQNTISDENNVDKLAKNEPCQTTPIGRVAVKIEKIVEAVEPRVTRITIPTSYRESFDGFLRERKVQQSGSFRTDVWNNIESAYTNFEVLAPSSVVDKLFEEWSSTLS